MISLRPTDPPAPDMIWHEAIIRPIKLASARGPPVTDKGAGRFRGRLDAQDSEPALH